MRVDVAIVGGTGVGDALMARPGSPLQMPTAQGWLRGRLFDEGGVSMLLVHRHTRGHRLPPHAIQYGAIALGLRQLGVKACLSSAAVGSLRADWGAGVLAVCSDFYDATGRNQTLFDRRVTHTDFSEPLDTRLQLSLAGAARDLGIEVEIGATYVCANGPRYETPREIEAMAKLGDVIGMTMASEAIAMREAGVPYACLAAVTNLAAGLSKSALSHEEVVAEMGHSGEKALRILLRAAVEVGRA